MRTWSGCGRLNETGKQNGEVWVRSSLKQGCTFMPNVGVTLHHLNSADEQAIIQIGNEDSYLAKIAMKDVHIFHLHSSTFQVLSLTSLDLSNPKSFANLNEVEKIPSENLWFQSNMKPCGSFGFELIKSTLPVMPYVRFAFKSSVINKTSVNEVELDCQGLVKMFI